MLYLNTVLGVIISVATLNLTLTSVVFELMKMQLLAMMGKFNFNKCCIWILDELLVQNFELDLTLTSVVFESYY